MLDIIRIEGFFVEKIWGGKKISQWMNVPNSQNNLGEFWFVSGMDQHSSSLVDEQNHLIERLNDHFHHNPNFYGFYPSDEFPLLIKIIDANDDLSVQVHPSDDYAKQHFNQNGKYEFWYVLDCLPTTTIAIGHDLDSKDKLNQALTSNEIVDCLNIFNIKKNDFFSIPTGTLHAIHKNTLIYEVQQASDLTFRVHDYNRKDKNEKARELHIIDALNAINVPCKFKKTDVSFTKSKHYLEVIMESNQYFKVSSIELNGIGNYELDGYFNIIGCIEGSGTINGIHVLTGTHLVISNRIKSIYIEGSMKLIRSTPIQGDK